MVKTGLPKRFKVASNLRKGGFNKAAEVRVNKVVQKAFATISKAIDAELKRTERPEQKIDLGLSVKGTEGGGKPGGVEVSATLTFHFG
jgi:hypothetical protein